MYKARRVSPWDNFISFGRICTCISVAIARGVPASAADLIWLVSPLISAADPDFLLCSVPMSDSVPVRCLHTAHAQVHAPPAIHHLVVALVRDSHLSPLPSPRTADYFLFHFQISHIVISVLGETQTQHVALEVVQSTVGERDAFCASDIWCGAD